MKSPAAIMIGTDPVVEEVGEAVGVMAGVRVCIAVGICVAVAIGLGVNVCVAVCTVAGVEVVVDVTVDGFTGVAVDIDALVVMTNWGAKPAVPSSDE
jgi:hypothetical protein